MDGSGYVNDHKPITEGDWAGWTIWDARDAFDQHVGPFYTREDADGRRRCAFRAERRHMNGAGFMHGGAIMTFADHLIFVVAHEALRDSYAVTATFDSAFVGAVRQGALVEGSGEIVKAGRSMIFVRGLVTSDGETVMSFSAVIKKTGPRTAPR